MRDIQKQIPLPDVTQKGKGLYLALYSTLSFNTDSTKCLGIIMDSLCIALQGRVVQN